MPTSKSHPTRSAAVNTKTPKPIPATAQKPAADAQAGRARTPPRQTKKLAPPTAESPSALIDAKINALGDWRGELLSRLRTLVKQAVPDVAEEWKWRGTPVWSHHGPICTGESYQLVVKTTFAKGALLADPSGLFNSSLEGNLRRAIDFHEGDKLDEAALKALIRAAAAFNLDGVNRSSTSRPTRK